MIAGGIGFRSFGGAGNVYNAVSGFDVSGKSFDSPTIVPTSVQKFTFSAWIKKTSNGATSEIYEQDGPGGVGVKAQLFFNSSDNLQLYVNSGGSAWTTTNTYTSTTTWYHVVLAVDTTQATAANRQIWYVDGVLQAGSGTAYSLNDNVLGSFVRMCRFGANVLQGYIAFATYVDGQQLTPSNFTTSGVSGTTVPKPYSGSFGTAGWMLKFANAAALGADTSGNGNNWNQNLLDASNASSQNVFYTSYAINYLVVGAGAGGGAGDASGNAGGAGGAGGLLTGSTNLIAGSVYTCTIGVGGGSSQDGTDSVLSGAIISTVTALGGGGGGFYNSNGIGIPGVNGSGGGSGGQSGSGGSSTVGQGHDGATNHTGGQGGGGGGAGAAGSGTTGGAGVASSITGASLTYAVGGAANVNAVGAANTGNGGSTTSVGLGSGGGSGVVILSVPTINYTGTTTGSPTITTSGANTIIKFTGNGTYTA